MDYQVLKRYVKYYKEVAC